jgi:hypothetical protein
MAIQPDVTTRQEYEWLLKGLLPKAALCVMDADIVRHQEQVRKLQNKLAEIQRFRKDIANGDWPEDDNGFITQSADNPL